VASPSIRLTPFWTAQLLGWGTYAAAKYAMSRALYPSVWRVLLLVGIGAPHFLFNALNSTAAGRFAVVSPPGIFPPFIGRTRGPAP
jgi:hypothetical protein